MKQKNEFQQKTLHYHPRAYYSAMKSMRGNQRITIKNADQYLLLDKVLEEDLTKSEIASLRDFLRHYARNYSEVEQITKGIPYRERV